MLEARTKEETYLDLNVEYTAFAQFNNGGYSLFASTVKVSREFCVLHETTLVEKRGEGVARDKMVLHAIDLSWSWGASGIF